MTTPFRQIRASYDEETVTVYQAYNSIIAAAAVAEQKLGASPRFRTTRMTWIKPSWAWMLYRAGYSYKDPGQERILALKMKHEDFIGLLERAVLTTHPHPSAGVPESPESEAAGEPGQQEAVPQTSGARRHSRGRQRGRGRDRGGGVEKTADVKVQWDPERSIRLERLPHRSIQIGIPAATSEEWVGRMIVSIEDVTDKARELKRVLDERPDVTEDELAGLGLIPEERPFEISEALRLSLRMDRPS